MDYFKMGGVMLGASLSINNLRQYELNGPYAINDNLL